MIYVMSPYSGTKPEMTKRYLKTVEVCAELMKAGVSVFSPIVHWHLAAELHNMPKDAGFWEKYNREMFDLCDAALLIKLDGWKKSKGVQMEMEWGEKAGKPLYVYNPGLPDINTRVIAMILEEI